MEEIIELKLLEYNYNNIYENYTYFIQFSFFQQRMISERSSHRNVRLNKNDNFFISEGFS